MELSQLQYFRAICETGSYTQAAEACHSRPSIIMS